MTIWLINPYGPLPGEAWRDYRFTLFGRNLAEAGHTVTWWTAGFSHHFKMFRSKEFQTLQVEPGFDICLVPTCGYRKNISFGRVRFEQGFALRLYRRALATAPPNCIIVLDSPWGPGLVAERLSARLGAKLVVDVMDLWPELFRLALPAALRLTSPLLFAPFYGVRRYTRSRADAIIALCETYRRSAVKRLPNRRSVPSVTIFNGIDVGRFRRNLRWADSGALPTVPPLGKQDDETWAIFAGTLGNNYDIETLLMSAQHLRDRLPKLKILVAGDGPLRHQAERYSGDNLVYVGRLAPEPLGALYARCDVGICAYGRGSNVAMPDKGYDYMAAGLAIVNSLNGEFGTLLAERQMGLQYEAGSAESLAACLATLATNQALLKRTARNAHATAMEFDACAQYSKLDGLVRQLCAR